MRSRYKQAHSGVSNCQAVYRVTVKPANDLSCDCLNSHTVYHVTLGFQSFDKSEVIRRPPVKKSQANSTYEKAEQLTCDSLSK